MSKRTARRLLIGLLACVAATATAGKALLNAAFDDFKGEGEHKSWDAAESLRRGVLVAELVAVPDVLAVPGGQVRFGQVWVEERSLSTHRFVWLPYEQRIGGYRLSFTLDGGQDLVRAGAACLAPDRGAGLGSSTSGPRTVYHVAFDGRDVPALQVRLSQAGGPAPDVVRFVPRPKS